MWATPGSLEEARRSERTRLDNYLPVNGKSKCTRRDDFATMDLSQEGQTLSVSIEDVALSRRAMNKLPPKLERAGRRKGVEKKERSKSVRDRDGASRNTGPALARTVSASRSSKTEKTT